MIHCATSRTQPNLTGRQARWVVKLAEYEFDIEHIPGKDNVVADALSRRPDYKEEVLEEKEQLYNVRAAGASRVDDMRERQQRARNVAAAKETHPPAPDRPLPDRHGAIVMPSQRCTATTAKGAHCKSRTAKGQFLLVSLEKRRTVAYQEIHCASCWVRIVR